MHLTTKSYLLIVFRFQTLILIGSLFLSGCVANSGAVGTSAAQTIEAINIDQKSPTPTIHNFNQFSVEEIVKAFKRVGLDISNPRAISLDKPGNEFPESFTGQGVSFNISSANQTLIGHIYETDNPDQRNIIYNYYVNLETQDPEMFSWLFVRDNILVQIDGRLPQDQAELYNATLQSFKA